MAQAGDSIISVLTQASLQWGTYRRHATREPRLGECYLPIRKDDAMQYRIYNSNINPVDMNTGRHIDMMGVNVFNVTATDGRLHGQVKMQGNSRRGDVHAKNMSGLDDLRALHGWLDLHHARIGSRVRITWRTQEDIELEFLG